MKPTRVRYKVVAFAVALAGVTYLDRVCISTLAPLIMKDLNLTNVQMSFVFSAFTLAYALFEIPTAWWGQRVGVRNVLTRIVLWWSTFTITTGVAWNYSSLLSTRFLFGAGEAGAWPNATRAFYKWIPISERGKVQGIFFMGAHLAGGITPAVVSLMLSLLTWRQVFFAFGLLGFLWSVAWYAWFRDEPSQHSAPNRAERELIASGCKAEESHNNRTWLILRNPSVLLLCAAYFSNGYGFYFLITWLPSYLEQKKGLGSGSLSLFAGLPLLLSVVADLAGGLTTDYLVRRFGLRFGRAIIGISAYAVAAFSILAATFVSSVAASSILIALAAAASMFTLAASWSACIDLGGDSSAVVSAAMNTTGQVGGVLSPIVLALLVDRFDNWSLPLFLMAALYSISCLCWFFVNPSAERPSPSDPIDR